MVVPNAGSLPFSSCSGRDAGLGHRGVGRRAILRVVEALGRQRLRHDRRGGHRRRRFCRSARVASAASGDAGCVSGGTSVFAAACIGPAAASFCVVSSPRKAPLASDAPFFIIRSAALSVFGGGVVAFWIAVCSAVLNASRRTRSASAASMPLTVAAEALRSFSVAGESAAASAEPTGIDGDVECDLAPLARDRTPVGGRCDRLAGRGLLLRRSLAFLRGRLSRRRSLTALRVGVLPRRFTSLAFGLGRRLARGRGRVDVAARGRRRRGRRFASCRLVP